MSEKPFPPNPYVAGAVLSGEAGFYGRQDIFVFVEDLLAAEQQNVVVLYGQRRVGKTSLLHQITRHLRGKDQVVPVYFDLQGKEQMPLGQVLLALAQKIARTLGTKRVRKDQFDDSGNFFRNRFLPSIYEDLGGRRLLLLFDEFDVLSDDTSETRAASETLFPYLNNLIMDQPQIAFIFVIGRRIEELTSNFQSVFKQAVFRRIGLLKPENARAVMTEPVKDILSFEDSAIDAVLDLTTGHPYFTQLVCFEVYRDMDAKNQRTVTEADILSVIDQAIESGHGALNWFWDGLPRAERFIMSAVAHVTDETGLAKQEDIRRILEKHRIRMTGHELKDAPERLVEWEMLRREEDNAYRFVVELVRRWILKSHPLESARRDIDLISKRASRMYENAREAHEEGDLEFAKDEYQRALDANPNHSGAQLGLAQVLFEQGETATAIEEFEKAYAYDDVNARDGLVRARQRLGKELEEANEEDLALIQYEHALKEAPSNEITHRRLAAIWRRRGDETLHESGLPEAAELYRKALEYEKDASNAEKIKASLSKYAQVGDSTNDQDFDKAIQATEKMLALEVIDQQDFNRRLASIWLRRGHFRLADSNVISAAQAYKEALAYDSDDSVGESIKDSLVASVEQAESDLDMGTAMQTIEQLNALLPENEAVVAFEVAFWTRSGDELAKTEDNVAEAIRAYQRVLELEPDSVEVRPKLELLSAEWEKLLEADDLFKIATTAHRDREWSVAQSNWLQILKLDFLDYKGQNIAALLAEAHSNLTRNPNLKLQLSAEPQRVETGRKVTWTVTLQHNGNDPLEKVTLYRGENQLQEPFNISPNETREVTFTESYDLASAKEEETRQEKVALNARSVAGYIISDEVSNSVVVEPAGAKLVDSLYVGLSSNPQRAAAGDAVVWTVRVENLERNKLSNVTVRRDASSRPIETPFTLAGQQAQSIHFERKYHFTGVKEENITVSATTGSGQVLRRTATGTVEVAAANESKTPANAETATSGPDTGEPAPAKSENIPSSERILNVLKRFEKQSTRFFVAPDIPASKERAARRHWKIPESETVLGLIDGTTSGSARVGLSFGSEGIYYSNPWNGIQPGTGTVPYSEFPNRNFRAALDSRVLLDRGQELHAAAYAFNDNSAKTTELLNAIRKLFDRKRPRSGARSRK